MEEERKKKRNKKKKNKQTIATNDDVASWAGEPPPSFIHHKQPHHVTVLQNHHPSAFDTTDDHNDAIPNKSDPHLDLDLDLDKHHVNRTQTASLEETIKQLQQQNDAHLEKEASLEIKILQLQSEKDVWLAKEVSMEEKIKQLERQRDSWIQKENTTEGVIARLNCDNTSLQTQVMELEESRNYLLQENQRLIENVSGQQSQIQELERTTTSARSSSVTTMHPSENDELNTQIEAARALVGKLVTENAELVDKVNELYAELDRHGVTAHYSSVIGSDLTIGNNGTAPVADPVFEFGKRAYELGKGMESVKDAIEGERNDGNNVNAEDAVNIADSSLDLNGMPSVLVDALKGGEAIDKAGVDDVHTRDAHIVPNFVETINSEEIVHIPLDGNQVQSPELPTVNDDEKSDVALSDAPLIGAPFRLISFVARYVSGADLVNKSSHN